MARNIELQFANNFSDFRDMSTMIGLTAGTSCGDLGITKDDCKLQIAGLNTGYDRIVTRPGDGGAVSFWYYRGDHLLAVDAMNDSRAYMVGKRLIESGKSPDPVAVADNGTDLKALLKA